MEMLVVFACVLALVLIDIPIAVSLGIVAISAMVVTQGTGSLPNLPVVLYNGATNFPLIAIPLFILAGAIMNSAGISRRLIAFASALLGFIRGGLAMVSIGASMFFAEISGSAVADVSALGSILIPAMKSKGYPAPLAAAIMSSAATLAVIIPPSIPMILYAVMEETSVEEDAKADATLLESIADWCLRYTPCTKKGYSTPRIWRAWSRAARRRACRRLRSRANRNDRD